MKYKFLLIVLLFSFYNSFAQRIDTAAVRLNNYRDKIFTVFNKCNLLDNVITNAIKAKNINDIEKGRTGLLQCATDGLKQLAAIEDFDGDPSLKYACRDVLKFYKQLAESDLPQVRDFFIHEDNFLKIQKEFRKKKVKKYSQVEISAYNAAAKKYNDAVTHYTRLNTFMTGNQKLILSNWNAYQKIFMKSHARTTLH